MFPFEQRGHTCGHRKPPRIFGEEIGVHSDIYTPLCDPPAPLPGQALVHEPRMGKGHPHTKKRLQGGRFRRAGLFAKIEPSAPCLGVYRVSTIFDAVLTSIMVNLKLLQKIKCPPVQVRTASKIVKLIYHPPPNTHTAYTGICYVDVHGTGLC